MKPSAMERQILVYWGPSGVGKSRWVLEECVNKGYSPYRVQLPSDNKSKNWFQGYDGQDTLWIDDYCGGYNLNFFLSMLDGFKNTQLEYKGGFSVPNYKRVFITSNKAPEEWYPKSYLNNPYQLDAVLRRINVILKWTGVNTVPEIIKNVPITVKNKVNHFEIPIPDCVSPNIQFDSPDTPDKMLFTSGNSAPEFDLLNKSINPSIIPQRIKNLHTPGIYVENKGVFDADLMFRKAKDKEIVRRADLKNSLKLQSINQSSNQSIIIPSNSIKKAIEDSPNSPLK